MKEKDIIDTSAIDIGKLFSAYIVIAIHTSFLGEFKEGVFYTILSKTVFCFAVPFFYVCSGFFLGRKLYAASSGTEYKFFIKRYFKRLFVPYVIWGIIYFMISIGISILRGNCDFKDALITYGHQWLMSSPGGGLWYVQTILILLAIIYAIGIRKKFNIFTAILFFAYILAEFIYNIPISAGGGYQLSRKIINVYETIFVNRLNFVFNGIFFAGGIQFSKYFKYIEKQVKYQRAIMYTVFLYIIYIITICLDGDIGFYKGIIEGILKIELVLGLFYILYNTKITMSLNRSKILRKISGVIYFTHFLSIYFYRTMLILAGKETTDYYTLTWTLCSITLTLYALVLIKIDKNKRIINLLY